MNYEKKYKEALEKASKLRVQNPFDTVGQMVEHIFPELKESEGERIRKEIMDFIDTNTIESDERRNRWFSYLEKYKPISFTSLDDTKVKMSLMQYISGLNKDVVRLHPGIETCNEWLSWLEKQGDMSKMCPTSVQDEQQPIDKVEPKFKVGDWITNGDYTWKIVEVKPLDYILQSQDGNIVDDTISHVDEQFHSFTIKDAKDGDVLYSHEHNLLWIYKNKEECHAAINLNYTNSISFGIGIVIPSGICPATKEQRDALFAKIKEEGYEWSEDTHELKKISQRMVSAEAKEALWSDKYEGLTDFERTLADICIGWIGEEPGWKQYIKDNADVLLKIAIEKFNSVQDTLFEQKPAWSEEDIRNIQDIDSILFYDKDLPEETCIRLRNWLKSLKPHTDMVEALRTEYEKGRADTIAEMEKDWSEEDDVMINKLLAVVKLYYDRSGDDLDKQSCISFLKSLKDKVQPQPKQEWSEEDEIARKALINLVEIYYGGCIDKTEKKRLLNLLKSLRPQNTWKPSEEQMSTLNLIISDYYHACTKECDKKAIVLKSILEQLKQL